MDDGHRLCSAISSSNEPDCEPSCIQDVVGKVQSAQVVRHRAPSSPRGLIDCAVQSFHIEHLDNASTTCSDQDAPDDLSAVSSEQPDELPAQCDATTSVAATKESKLLPEVHTATQPSCSMKPTFSQRADGSFLMELLSIDVELNTTCFSTEPLPDDMEFQPHIDVCVAIPEVQMLVFDPTARTPAGMCMAATAHKCRKVMDVPLGYDLKSKICAFSTTGRETLKERLYTNGCGEMPADVHLNYELRVSGTVSTCNHQAVLEVDIAFRCWLNDFAMGFLFEGEWWGLVVTQPPDAVLSKPESAEYELSYIENRIEEIGDTLSKIDSGILKSSCLSPLEAELVQLKKDAAMCEATLLYEASPGALHSDTQVAGSPQNNMLRRFLELYESLESAHQKALGVKHATSAGYLRGTPSRHTFQSLR